MLGGFFMEKQMKNTRSMPPDSSMKSMNEEAMEPYGMVDDDDRRFTLTEDYAMGRTVSSDYVRVTRKPVAHEELESVNLESNFNDGLVLRQPL